MNDRLLNSMFKYGNKSDYEKILRDTNYNETAAWHEFRKVINKNKIEIIKMEDITNSKDNKELLIIYLQELFLEYIDVYVLRNVELCMSYNGWTWEKVYQEHIKFPYKRILNIVSGSSN